MARRILLASALALVFLVSAQAGLIVSVQSVVEPCKTGSEPGCAPSLTGVVSYSDSVSNITMDPAPLEKGFLWQQQEMANMGSFGISGFVNTDAEPFIAYGIAVSNFTGATMSFSFVFSSPYVGGPYDLLKSSHSDSFTDSGAIPNGAVTIGTFLHPKIHWAILDGVGQPAVSQNPGCVAAPGVGGSGSCFPAGPVLSTGVATPATGNFSIELTFKVSPHDIYTANGRLELAKSGGGSNVPEPGSFALFASGIGLVAFGAWRRRQVQ